MSRYGIRKVSNHDTVSLTAAAWPQFTYSRWVMIRIQTPASDKRQSASLQPSKAGSEAIIRRSVTA